MIEAIADAKLRRMERELELRGIRFDRSNHDWVAPQIPADRALMERRAIRPAFSISLLSRGASHAANLVHRIRSGFPPAQSRRRRRDVSRSLLGRAAQDISAATSLYARSRTEMARKACSSIAHPPAAPEFRCGNPGRPAHTLELLVAPRGKPSPQAVVAFDGFADRRRPSARSASIAAAKARLRRSSSIRARYCRKTAGVSSFGCRMAAHSSALVRRKKPKSGLPSCRGPSLSISLAIAMTASLSALSNVTAKRRIASCQARSVLACHSLPGTFELIRDASMTWRPNPCESGGRASSRPGRRDPRRRFRRSRSRPRLSPASSSSTIGRRVAGDMKPSRHSAYFRAAGLSLVERGRQRRQPALQIARGLQSSLPAARKDRLAQIRRDIRYQRYAAIPAIGDEGERGCVVSGQQPKSRRQQRPQAHGARDIAGAIPQSDELPGFRQPRQRVVGQFADGPGGNVVQDDGQRGRDRRSPESAHGCRPASACCNRARPKAPHRRRRPRRAGSARWPGWSNSIPRRQ